jgi:hypothetical protein
MNNIVSFTNVLLGPYSSAEISVQSKQFSSLAHNPDLLQIDNLAISTGKVLHPDAWFESVQRKGP